MNKLKKFYENNRIYCILMIISTICLLIILTSIIVYFVSQTKTSVYGNRLDGIEEHEVNNDLNELKSYFESNDKVKKVSTDIRGKIIYVEIEVNEQVGNEEIQTICTESLSKLSDDNKSFYDLQYIVRRDNLNPYLGSKSAHQTIIAWANYSFEEEKSDDQNTQEGE